MAALSAVPGSREEMVGMAATRTIAFAARALRSLEERFGDPAFRASFEALIDLICQARGRVILAGIGKSGIIARKIAGTLLSTGTPAAFMHPSEASHGDLGMVSPDDVVIMLTRSGETSEFSSIIEYCRRFAVPLVAITTRAGSTVGKAADLCIRLPQVREACPNELTPTTSTTLQVVFGDTLAMALMEVRGFSAEDFHKYHPGGRLGARLLKVRDVMARGGDIPVVARSTSLLDATIEMTRARLGGTAIVDDDDRLIGVFTDGDLRRLALGELRMADPIGEHMTQNPHWIGPSDLAFDAVRRMQENKVLLLFVCEGQRVVGALHMHDLLRAGVA